MSASEETEKAETAAAQDATATPAENATEASASDALEKAESAIDSLEDSGTAGGDAATAFQLEDLVGDEQPPEKCSIDLLRDVDLDLKIELGRTHMLLEDVLRLRQGSVVTLDKLAGDPVDLIVNGRLVAKGEILVLNDNFCVRIAELVGSDAIED